MEIKTYSGKLTAMGKYIAMNDVTVYDYLEVQQEDGEFVKLVNATVRNDALRALSVGNSVKLVVCVSPKGKSQQFPSNDGLNFVYAAYSEKDNRVFDDTALWNKDRSTFGNIVAFWSFALIAFTLFLLGGAANSAMGGQKDFAVLWLMGLIVPLVLYFLTVHSALKALSMMASSDDISPIIAKLK
jgi:hypothetical protein